MRRRWSGICGIVILLASAFLLGLLLTRSEEPTGPLTAEAPLRLRPAAIVEEVRRELENGYYRDVAEGVLTRPSVGAMLAALGDPYTEYLTPSEYGRLESSTAGRYSGVGLTVGPARAGLRVSSVLEGPAGDAGIRNGDVIVSVDGRATRRLRFERALELIQGKTGTEVELTVRRALLGSIRFRLVREELPEPTNLVRTVRVAGQKLGYVRIYSFSKQTSEDLRAATRRLVADGARGLVLDLRDNTGGLLVEAVESATLFLASGVVCTTEGAHQGRRIFRVDGPTPFPKLPLVVLVNRGSASASEILAAGLAENGRALLVGQRTYGKAAVQSLRELSNGAALKLTTATYRTPDGHSLHGRGIGPATRAVDDPATPRDEALVVAGRALLERPA